MFKVEEIDHDRFHMLATIIEENFNDQMHKMLVGYRNDTTSIKHIMNITNDILDYMNVEPCTIDELTSVAREMKAMGLISADKKTDIDYYGSN
jgi:mevalonate kinase